MNEQTITTTQPSSEVDALAQFRAFQATHDLALRDQLVCKHLHLVHGVSRRFSGLGESLDDLIQEGSIGLLKAVDMFDPDRGVKFSTYACHLITSQIQHYLRDRGRLIRQPAWVQELNTKVAKATEQLTQELGRDPQLSEVAERLNLTEASVHHAMAARELNSVISLNLATESSGEGELPVADKEKVLNSKLAALQLPVEDRIVLEEAVSNLKTLEQNVIRLFFFEDLNQSEIARKLGISVNYASYLLRRSITKIKTVLEEQRSSESVALQETAETVPIVQPEIPTYHRIAGLYTGDYLRSRVAEEIARGRRYPTNFALMLAQVEGFTGSGDESLPMVTAIGQFLRQSTRLIDLTAYLDYGRFALLLPHTGREAKILGQRLCQQMPIHFASSTGARPLVLHVGYAVYPMEGSTVDSLFKHAENSLTASIKGTGRAVTAGPSGR